MTGRQEQDRLWEAQELIWDAWETDDRSARIEMAEAALQISPLCADAYNLLAGDTRGKKKCIDLYRKGMAAGEQALGVEVFSRGIGDFWGLHETRPYMRSRMGLAEALWNASEADEAIGHYEALLALSRNDNLGVRYALVLAYIEADDVEAADALLSRFPEDTAWMLWPSLLVRYWYESDGGETPVTDQRASLESALAMATEANPFVLAYLTGLAALPKRRPATYAHGSNEEAILFAARALPAWEAVPGALDWLRSRDDWNEPRCAS